MTNQSEWHSPAAVTRSRTCPGPGSGVGISTTSGPPPIVRYCTARMRAPQDLGPCRWTVRWFPPGRLRTHAARSSQRVAPVAATRQLVESADWTIGSLLQDRPSPGTAAPSADNRHRTPQARRTGQSAVAGDHGGAQQLGECDVRAVVGADRVAELEDAVEERFVPVSGDRQVTQVTDRGPCLLDRQPAGQHPTPEGGGHLHVQQVRGVGRLRSQRLPGGVALLAVDQEGGHHDRGVDDDQRSGRSARMVSTTSAIEMSSRRDADLARTSSIGGRAATLSSSRSTYSDSETPAARARRRSSACTSSGTLRTCSILLTGRDYMRFACAKPRRVTAQGDPRGHLSMKAARPDYDVVMATPRSVRLSDDVLRRLTDLAGQRGTSVSSTIERLLDEALRREAHPGVTFRDGPSGRRAGLVAGPDVDEVIRTLRGVQEERHEDVVAAVAEMTSLTEAQVRAGQGVRNRTVAE